MANLTDFLLSNRLTEVSVDAVLLYSLMRADVESGSTELTKLARTRNKLVSGFDVHTMCTRTGLPVGTVSRCLGELIRRGWIKVITDVVDTYQLGTLTEGVSNWFCDVPTTPKKKEESIVDQIRRMAAETAARRAAAERVTKVHMPKPAKVEAARTILSHLSIGSESKGKSGILSHFKSCYHRKYGKPVILSGPDEGRAHAKAYGLINGMLRYASSDVDAVCDLITFVFEQWEGIRAATTFTGEPNLELFGTKRVFDMFRDFKMNGIPKERKGRVGDGLGTRGTPDKFTDAPDEGFGE